MKTIKAKIRGTVQGVFFRNFVKEQADALQIKGHVRNIEGGEVEVVAEGKDENVNKLLEVCKQGPPHSIVKEVNSEPMTHQGLEDFKVLNVM